MVTDKTGQQERQKKSEQQESRRKIHRGEGGRGRGAAGMVTDTTR